MHRLGEASALTIRQVGAEGLCDFLAAAEAAFGASFARDEAALRSGVEEGTVGLHVAYVAGRSISAGRLETPPGRTFAGLYTGGVAPDQRGRGVYRALVRVRAEQAVRARAKPLTGPESGGRNRASVGPAVGARATFS